MKISPTVPPGQGEMYERGSEFAYNVENSSSVTSIKPNWR